MLLLTKKIGETIILDGDIEITLTGHSRQPCQDRYRRT